MDFQLDAIDTVTLAEDGVYIPLKRLDGEPLLNAKGEPVQLRLHGSDSEAYRKASRALARKRMERAQARKKLETVTDADLEAAAAEDLDMIVACTSGWKGILDSNQKPIPFSPEGARELYTRFPVAREQADTAIMDRARFTKGSSDA